MKAFRRLIEAIEAEGSGAFVALEAANEALRLGRGAAQRRSLALGPELGQCCGGRVEWRVETFDERDLDELSAFAIAEGGALAALSARLGPDGRVQRTLGSSASERRLARLAEASWTEPLGVLARAVY